MKEDNLSENYQQLAGSELHPSPKAKLLGPADPSEIFSVTIMLRRRPDGPPMPEPMSFASTPPSQRRRLPEAEFAAKYGAAPEDIEKVTEFARQCNLTVVKTHAARRTVVLSGSVAQMSKAFVVSLGRYENEFIRSRAEKPITEIYRGHEGFIHVPKNLADSIIGIYGLDNCPITKCANGGDPQPTKLLTVPEVTKLYNFPPNSAVGQTIAIFSVTGYLAADLKLNFDANNYPGYDVADVPVDAANLQYPDIETTQDIIIAGLAAPGAKIRVYFTTPDKRGWVDLISRVIHPDPGDPVCSVLSSSFFVSYGDDLNTLNFYSIPTSWIDAVHSQMHEAMIQRVTVCVCSGDWGTANGRVFNSDDKAHVLYPASDPWVLSVGGTTIGNVRNFGEIRPSGPHGVEFGEYVWNDDNGATGGGVSDYFQVPIWQTGINPTSLNDGHIGRGVPDVAANASLNSGYPIYLGGSLYPFPMGGTSASTPLWAGLIAVINAAVGYNIGFVNPAFYEIGSFGFRDIVGAPGPADNKQNNFPEYPELGYPAGPGWDACTGWGSPNGVVLLASLIALDKKQWWKPIGHDLDVAWIIALWYFINGGDPGGDEISGELSESFYSEMRERLPKLDQDPVSILRKLSDLGVKVKGRTPDNQEYVLQDHKDVQKFAEAIAIEGTYVRSHSYCFEIKGSRTVCVRRSKNPLSDLTKATGS